MAVMISVAFFILLANIYVGIAEIMQQISRIYRRVQNVLNVLRQCFS